ncbi:hypothetical protein H6G41_12325 [Tolypothrix sp. FACHB-123]|uniref:hypothetical protein n=1 Tax=Tolypothrix sp. FACHB-123 TaxID=2692868 RepID=UPI001688D86A|nr:hypothetical protein [Tolypothrix sp. FACHB-123]MBD2355394.1 hypothetical protein [Tolypothrix sp. FACHB-123]
MLYNPNKKQLETNQSKLIDKRNLWEEIPESFASKVSGGGGQVLVTSGAQKISYMADLTCGEGGVDPVDYGG